VILGGSQEETCCRRSQVQPCHRVSFQLLKLLNHHTKPLLLLPSVTPGISDRHQLQPGFIWSITNSFCPPPQPKYCSGIPFSRFGVWYTISLILCLVYHLVHSMCGKTVYCKPMYRETVYCTTVYHKTVYYITF
jgi:hypothetical protein